MSFLLSRPRVVRQVESNLDFTGVDTDLHDPAEVRASFPPPILPLTSKRRSGVSYFALVEQHIAGDTWVTSILIKLLLHEV